MADLTKNLALTADWQHVSDELSLADGSTYLMDATITGKLTVGNDAIIHWALTNNATEPTDELIPHAWRVTVNDVSPQSQFAQKANEELWMRIVSGNATLVVTGL